MLLWPNLGLVPELEYESACRRSKVGSIEPATRPRIAGWKQSKQHNSVWQSACSTDRVPRESISKGRQTSGAALLTVLSLLLPADLNNVRVGERRFA